MTLKEFAETVMIGAGFVQNPDDVVKYITWKAGEFLNRKDGGVDDETVKGWILECRNGVPQTTVTYGAANKGEVKHKQDVPKGVDEVKAERKYNDKKMSKDTYMESLF